MSRLAVSPLSAGLLLLAGCGAAETPSPPSADNARKNPTAAEAAVTGIAEVVSGKEDAGKNLPAFVERPADARIMMTSHASMGERRSGHVLYAAQSSPDALIAFHKAAFARHGLAAGEETIGKRGQRILKGESADGKAGLIVSIHPPKANSDVAVELNYFEPAAK